MTSSHSYLYAPAIVVSWVLALWIVKRVAARRLTKWAAGSAKHWGNTIIDSFSFPANLLILASGLALLTSLLSLPKDIHRMIAISFQGCFVLAIALFLDSFVKMLVDQYASQSIFNKVSHGLMKGLLRGFIIVVGVLIFLDMIGISITPILASLGIGSVAVALALQDTLSNFFAGLYVTIDKPVRVGDLIRLESGNEGVVTEVGWRSTRIRTLTNNVVIIPNTKLTSSVLTNYDLPNKEIIATLEARAPYTSDLERVERVTREAAKEALLKISGVVREFDPVVNFHTFGDTGVGFTIVFKAKDFPAQGPIKHELIKSLHARYQKEGIQIPTYIGPRPLV
ncbi:MAG: hypothetical protein AUJ72_01815 [Candidatus Omnitrophica bacterium CG1_02_46_14]|nr:MAG: hypothetical protein AUJ72_01815 [Candidatus Omnitrophica bacterium CG1_02_46_14]